MAVIKRVSLVDQVYDKLRERIVQLKIPFGSKLNVSKLQEEYGVSSTPVREALNRLLNEGLIEFENNVGARVIDITEKDVREIQEISFSYQMVAARNALRNGDAAQRRLKNILKNIVLPMASLKAADVSVILWMYFTKILTMIC